MPLAARIHGMPAESMRAGRGESLFFAAALLLATAPLDALALHHPALMKLRAACWAVVYLGFAVLAAIHTRPALAALGRNLALVAMAGLALLSALWSGQPVHTLAAGLQVLSVVVFGSIIGARTDPDRMVMLLFWPLFLGGLASLAMSLGHPLGTDINGNAVGLYNHKNTLGQRATFLGLASAAILLAGRPRLLPLAGLGLAGVLLVMSGSRTSWVVAAGTAGLLGVIQVWRLPATERVTAGLAAAALACVGGAVLVSGWFDPVDALFGAMDRDSGMTGRTTLWQLGWRYFLESPALGYGFAGFWDHGDPTSRAAWVAWVMREELPHFHNGYLEMAVELGVVGVAALLGVLAHLTARMAALERQGAHIAAAFGLAAVAAVIVTNMTEVALIERHGFILMALAALAARAKAP